MIVRKKKALPAAYAVQTARPAEPFSALGDFVPLRAGERGLYAALREAVPVVDAALDKIVRLVGGFRVECAPGARKGLSEFLANVPVNAAQAGVQSFLDTYLSQLLTFGSAVGEMVVRGGELAALYNASLDDVELRADGPLGVEIRRREAGGSVPVRYPELVLCSALNPPPGSAAGVSLLHGLPFVSGILLRIFGAVGKNWERVGDVRFSVAYRPGPDEEDRAYAAERAKQIATEWGRAMRGGSVSDFICVGDVDIRAIGADNQVLDSEVPVRQMLEQIVAKLGVPPFLLGLSWSSTERMSSQQADILTSELESYRRLLNPVVSRICSLWLRLNGWDPAFEIVWDDVTLQDASELAAARYRNAQAAQIERKLIGEKGRESE